MQNFKWIFACLMFHTLAHQNLVYQASCIFLSFSFLFLSLLSIVWRSAGLLGTFTCWVTSPSTLVTGGHNLRHRSDDHAFLASSVTFFLVIQDVFHVTKSVTGVYFHLPLLSNMHIIMQIKVHFVVPSHQWCSRELFFFFSMQVRFPLVTLGIVLGHPKK